MDWIRDLLFGSEAACHAPPDEVQDIILQLEAEDVPWQHIMENGGLTDYAYQVQGDAAMFAENLEREDLAREDLERGKEPPPPPFEQFRTHVFTRLWQRTKMARARQVPVQAPPVSEDDAILKEILLGAAEEGASYEYRDAQFWGNVARRAIDVRRPLNDVRPLPPTDVRSATQTLYDVTCEAYGQRWHPFSMHMVPHSKYVDPVHWKKETLLRSFMSREPSHPLTKTVQELLVRSIEEILGCERPSALLLPSPGLDALLHNVKIIHSSVPAVAFVDEPPKLVDVFHRLLALCQKDSLWESLPHTREERPSTEGIELFLLHEHVQSLERQNKLLWNEKKFN